MSEVLRGSCYEYFVAQQSLARAEDEHVQLQSIKTQLLQQIKTAEAEINRIAAAREALENERQMESVLPRGVPLSAFNDYIAREKMLYADLCIGETKLQQHQGEISTLRASLRQEGESAALLEEALASQHKFNQILTKTFRTGVERLGEYSERRSGQMATKDHLQRELQQLGKVEQNVRSTVTCKADLKARAQEQLREKDLDALRLRKDALFARRLCLSEVEHSRNQDTALQELHAQNQRLRVLVNERRKGRPCLRSVVTGGGRAPYTMTDAREETELQLETNEPAIIGETHSFTRRTAESSLLDKVRKQNLALLHQMVSSLHAVQLSVEKAPESSV